MRTAIEDALFELKERHKVELSYDDIDKVLEQALKLALRHKAA